MIWEIKVKPAGKKVFLKSDSQTGQRIKKALVWREKSDNLTVHPKVRTFVGAPTKTHRYLDT
jgi:hypothetical protein